MNAREKSATTLAAGVFGLSLIMSGCSQGTSSSAETTTDASVSAEAAPSSAPVAVTVVSKLPERTLKSLMEDYGDLGDGACQMALGAAMDSTGSSVELEAFGQPVLTARFEPSPVNGTQLPCRLEATFDGVPGGATEYAVRLIGGSLGVSPYNTSVDWMTLKNDGYTITIGD